MIWMILILELGIKFGIFEVNICNTWLVLDVVWLINTKFVLAHREFLVLHNVLSQCTSLVTEYVVNHSKLLIQV